MTNQFHNMLEDIKNKIHQGNWGKGEKIPTLPELSESYHVSISTAREVLKVLENRGYIVIQQGRGTFISSQPPVQEESISSQAVFNLMQLNEFRLMIEPQFAEIAAKQAFQEEIEAIYASAKHMSDLVENNLPTIQEDMTFHMMISQATHNDFATESYRNIQEQLKYGRRRLRKGRPYERIRGMKEKAVHYHLMIAEALKSRNAEKAKVYMQSHMEASRELVLYELTNISPQANNADEKDQTT